VVYGTDDGVYISDMRNVNREPVKVLTLLDVSQVDVLEDYQLLIVLSGKLNFSKGLVITDVGFRTTSHHVPLGCTRSYGSDVWSETSQENFVAYYVLQSWCLLREDPCVHSQIKSVVEYHKGSRADRPDCAW
jgi:hypothetical protein